MQSNAWNIKEINQVHIQTLSWQQKVKVLAIYTVWQQSNPLANTKLTTFIWIICQWL